MAEKLVPPEEIFEKLKELRALHGEYESKFMPILHWLESNNADSQTHERIRYLTRNIYKSKETIEMLLGVYARQIELGNINELYASPRYKFMV